MPAPSKCPPGGRPVAPRRTTMPVTSRPTRAALLVAFALAAAASLAFAATQPSASQTAAQPATGSATTPATSGAKATPKPASSSAKAAPQGSAKTKPPASSAPQIGVPNLTAGQLPDSVVLRIEKQEDVTLRRFERAVRLLGGDPDSLTPADRDRFLELVVEQRLLALATSRDPHPWPRADSAKFWSERDAILIRAAISEEFTRIEDRRRALGQPDLDEQAMGIAARESLMLELHPKWDEDALKMVGSYFAEMPQATGQMSIREQIELANQMPKIPAKDTMRVLVRSDLGTFTVHHLLAQWRRLSGMYRPTVKDAEGVRALVENNLFELHIRKIAAQPALAQRPEVRAVIADRIEYHSVATYLQRELVEGIPTDSVTLEKHYRANRAEFDKPSRAVMVAMTLEGRREADSLARAFTVPGEAESLAFRAQRGGVNYTLAVTEASDSLLFRKAKKAGADAVMGPEKVEGGWRVIKVMQIEPKATQPFNKVRGEVQRSWYEFESERRIRGRLDQLKREAHIQYNDKVLRGLVLSGNSGRG